MSRKLDFIARSRRIYRLGCSLLSTKPVIVVTAVLIFAVNTNQPVHAQEGPNRSVLQTKIENRLAGFRGDVGVFVQHLETGEVVEVRADELFPAASMVKIPIMLTLFDRMQQDTLSLATSLVYQDSLLYPGADILGSFKDGEEIELSKVLLLMETMSDNTASLWLQEVAGTGVAINKWLSENGFSRTRMNSRTPGRTADWEEYGWGQTTPREMAGLLTMIRKGEAISPRASETMYRTLTRSYWNGEALSRIPPYVQAATKQGAVSASKSEVVLVNAPSGDYVFCIITDNQEDVRWAEDNEGYQLIRDISEMLWQHFEPTSQWTPAARGGN